VNDLLWADPALSASRFTQGTRGDNTHNFGPEALKEFLTRNKLVGMIRSHQFTKHGYERPFPGLLTIFSCSSYKADISNPSVVALLRANALQPEIVTYPPLPRMPRSSAGFFSYNFMRKPGVFRSNSIGWGDQLNPALGMKRGNSTDTVRSIATGIATSSSFCKPRGTLQAGASQRRLTTLKLMTFQTVVEEDEGAK
jgi:hypothetical protein